LLALGFEGTRATAVAFSMLALLTAGEMLERRLFFAAAPGSGMPGNAQ
jgi:hypothetical protein